MTRQQQDDPIPAHIAIIMDGNGRWAQQRGLPRSAGHRAGVETVRHIVRACADLGLEVLTLYTFSTENWRRPEPEVALLMRLAEDYARREVDELDRNNVQVRMLGHREGLPASLLRAMDEGIRRTAHNMGLVLNLAINYGGRAEIVDAARAMVTAARQGKLNPALLDETVFGRFLYTAALPDPDLVIRTAGEMRLSNFLIWQAVGALFWSTPVYWPNFDKISPPGGHPGLAGEQRKRDCGPILPAAPAADAEHPLTLKGAKEEATMKLEDIVHTIASTGQAETLANVTASAIQREPVRRMLMGYVDRRINQRLEEAYDVNERRPPGVIQDKAHIFRALVHSVDRALAQGNISETLVKKVLRDQVNVFAGSAPSAAYGRFYQEHGGYGPPFFLVISPGKLCNLRCKGCYASSGNDSEKLDWEVFDRIITEARTIWGSRFIVISGGEPLAYRSQGKGVLDAAAKHQDMFFLMYTNGTLIDEKMAARMAEVGNLTPAISVEGWEERTDARRGKGVFQRVLQSMANLRQAGVPFGISLTATCENCEEILSDEFLDFFFEEQGAMYGWIFQYMPIGRGLTLDLLPTPEQRVWMWERTWQVVREKKYFLADFWNLGPCSDGCISAGRHGGYLYIDWNGKVMPCVFVPYSPVNVNDAYREGKTLNDVLEDPFFKAIREWQDEYGYAATRLEEHNNWLMPCPIRDHHRDFRRILEATEPDPEDEAALQAMIDPAYRDGLIKYDEAVARLMNPIWEREYLGNGRESQSGGR